MEFLMNIDYSILDAIQRLQNPILTLVMWFFTTIGEVGAVWIFIALILICQKKYRVYGVMILVALLAGYLIGNLAIKNIVARMRPYVSRPDIILLIKQPSEYSFPSGHTLSSFESAVILCYMNRKAGVAAFILAGLIAFSRLYFYVHFPSDILAGIFLAIVLAWIVIKIFQKKWDIKSYCG